MKVRYVGPFDSVLVPVLSAYVSRDETVDVDEDLGALMCEQAENWQAVDAPKGSTAAPVELPDPEPIDHDEV